MGTRVVLDRANRLVNVMLVVFFNVPFVLGFAFAFLQDFDLSRGQLVFGLLLLTWMFCSFMGLRNVRKEAFFGCVYEIDEERIFKRYPSGKVQEGNWKDFVRWEGHFGPPKNVLQSVLQGMRVMSGMETGLHLVFSDSVRITIPRAFWEQVRAMGLAGPSGNPLLQLSDDDLHWQVEQSRNLERSRLFSVGISLVLSQPPAIALIGVFIMNRRTDETFQNSSYTIMMIGFTIFLSVGGILVSLFFRWLLRCSREQLEAAEVERKEETG